MGCAKARSPWLLPCSDDSGGREPIRGLHGYVHLACVCTRFPKKGVLSCFEPAPSMRVLSHIRIELPADALHTYIPPCFALPTPPRSSYGSVGRLIADCS